MPADLYVCRALNFLKLPTPINTAAWTESDVGA